MPTQAKVDKVAELQGKLERCSIAISTGYRGIGVNDMTELRRRMREGDVEFLVIKNTLTHLAADAAQRSEFKGIVDGPTALAFGYDDPVDTAKTVSEYIRSTRSPLQIQGALLSEGQILPAQEVERLASLPPKPQWVAQLLGQMQAPMQRLLGVMNGPLQNLGGLLQARIRQLEAEGSGG
ncbi:MAG: 50S ribosomal protein L10 [Dehalococcoidia bacterium]